MRQKMLVSHHRARWAGPSDREAISAIERLATTLDSQPRGVDLGQIAGQDREGTRPHRFRLPSTDVHPGMRLDLLERAEDRRTPHIAFGLKVQATLAWKAQASKQAASGREVRRLNDRSNEVVSRSP